MGDYLFVLFDVDALSWRNIWQTRHVKDILGMSKYKPTVVPNFRIRVLQAKYARKRDVIQPGSLVGIVAGKHHVGEIGICEHITDTTVAVAYLGPSKNLVYAFDRKNVVLTQWVKHESEAKASRTHRGRVPLLNPYRSGESRAPKKGAR
jgi:hypothetical protein